MRTALVGPGAVDRSTRSVSIDGDTAGADLSAASGVAWNPVVLPVVTAVVVVIALIPVGRVVNTRLAFHLRMIHVCKLTRGTSIIISAFNNILTQEVIILTQYNVHKNRVLTGSEDVKSDLC